MDAITFFDMLGIDPGTSSPDPSAVDAAAALWPTTIVSQTPGVNSNHDSRSIVLFLQGVPHGRTVQFSNVRPGVDGATAVGSGKGQFSLAADVKVFGDVVGDLANTFYFRQLPDVGVSLFPTKPGAPARCFFAKDSRGWELIIEALPVMITLKPGLIEPSDPAATTEGDDPIDFSEDELDNLISVRKQNPAGTQLYTNVRIHIRPGGDVIFEPNIPINLPASRVMGLPVTALYDLLLIPAPQNREYYEWARNDLSNFLAPNPVGGAVGFRSLAFDLTKPPFSDLVASLKGGSVHTDNIELVCEDVVFPLSLGLPLPSHGTVGFRRKIVDRSDLANAFSLKAAPVIIQLYPRPSPSTDPANASTTPKGSTWSLSIDQLLLQSGEPPVIEFQAAVIWQNDTGSTVGGSVAIADDWTVQLGLVLGDLSPVKFTIADTTVALHAFKLGLGIGRLMRKIPFAESWQVLVDLSIKGTPSGKAGSMFKLRSMTGKPLTVILRDIGWSFGHASIDGLSFPEGMQFIVCDTFRLIIEEMGWVEEPDGTSYFSFSGGLGFGASTGSSIPPSGAVNYGTPPPTPPPPVPGVPPVSTNGFSIEVRRLRFRTNDDATQPLWKIDGISLGLKYGKLSVSGFGFLSDLEQNGWRVREMGFGVQVQLNFLATDWNLAAQFFKGHRQLIANPDTAFDYFMAALTVGYLPAGSVGLYSVRALMANNMTPAVDPSSPDGQGMALYKWHKDHDTAIDMPRDRNLGDWLAVDNTMAFGLGCGFSFNGCGSAFHLNIFVLYSKSDTERGLLVVGELFLLKNPKPLAFVAIEYDLDTNKFGILAGLNFKLTDFISVKADVPSWMANIATITGNIYVGNQPCTVALGQIADQRTWPSIAIQALGFSMVLGVCFQWVEGGPKGFGLVFTLTYGKKFGIGEVNIFGSIGLEIGNWKTGSDATGFEAWAQLGVKIYLFSILHIGMDATVKYAYLGKHPWYKSYSLTLRIDTPWWMPDVTFTLDETTNESLPYDIALLPRALAASSALGGGAVQEVPLLVPPLAGGNVDAAQLYSFNELMGLAGSPLGDVYLRNDLPVVATDATIAINFTNPVSNDMAVAQETYGLAGDAGVQTVKDMTLRYGLKSIAVRRSPRFGVGAGVWTDLVAPTTTALDLGSTVQLAPALAFRWDIDSRAEGVLSPKRLLINSSTPYTFSTGGAQNDEEGLRNDPGFPCCNTGAAIKQYIPRGHVLSFGNVVAGTRVPSRQQFSAQGVWWQWSTTPQPLATTGMNPATANLVVALVHPTIGQMLGGADLSDPGARASCSLSWSAAPVTVYFEGYAGLKLVARQSASLATVGSITLQVTAPAAQPMTRLLLRVEGLVTFPAVAALQVERIDYVTAAEDALYKGRISRCGSMATTGGKLSFLPNTDYEVTVTTEVRVAAKSQGQRSRTLAEVVYFRTKGWPGLNAVATPGAEIEPYIESLYPPGQAVLLYRAEPVALAFTEGMSSILPVDRVSAPSDPPEKTQAMKLVLNIDRVGSSNGLARLTVPSGDWIDAHRMDPPIRRFPRPLVLGTDAKSGVRKATSLDLLTLRYVAVQTASPNCSVDPLRASQLLVHQAIGGDNQAGPWEASATFRATVRQENGPYAQRTSFDLKDSGAFLSQSDGITPPAAAWRIDASAALVAPASVSGRQYAAFGDLNWNHLQIRAQFDPRGVAAGIAVGVAGGSPVPQAILATVEPSGSSFALVLRARFGGVETELGRAAVVVTAPVTLTVFAFDDKVRAQVGEIVVEAPRNAIREGRVALVANGAAAFSAVSVDSLDLYRFDFSTSRYQSFTEHLQSWDGNLIELTEGAVGAPSTALAGLLAADGPVILAAMTLSADPQARQSLFQKWIAALALPLRQQPVAFAVSRWTGPSGTQALVLESPEPISFVRDVSVTLIKHVPQTGWRPFGDAAVQAMLAALQFTAAAVTIAPALDKFAEGDLIVRVGGLSRIGTTFAIYAAPLRKLLAVVPGKLVETVTPMRGARPELDALRSAPTGTIALVRKGRVVAAISPGLVVGPAVINQPITLTVFANGSETAALLVPVATNGILAPMTSGKYTLQLTMNRSRWRGASSSDPEAVYTQSQSFELNW